MRLLLAILFVAAPAFAESEGERLHALFSREWEYAMRESPLWASTLGDRRYNDRWDDRGLAALERRRAHSAELLEELGRFDEAKLSPADRVNYRLFRHEYTESLERHGFRLHFLQIDQRGGPQSTDEYVDSLRYETVKDYEDWAARLEAFPAYLEQITEVLREGARTKVLHPRFVLERVPEQIRARILDEPEKSRFYEPFKRMPADWAPEVRERLAARGAAAVREGVVPAFKRFLEFFEKEYLPAASPEAGLRRLPRGLEAYAFLARSFTTTPMTPPQIHALGLSEVKRIRAEMETVKEASGFKGSLRDYMDHLRTDPRYFYNDPEALLAGYRAIAKRIDPEMTKLFGKLPRAPYGVVPIPAESAPHTTTAYYWEPAADGSRAGAYYVNLYKPETRPKWEMEALTVHEAVPGHHMQISLAQELGELPKFRRYGGYTAFVEGWGLYSESLGYEIGLYQDPASKFGQLAYEMWRAVRLVVDTGIHHYGWSREKVIDYFRENTPKTEIDIANETDRYVVMPGQALAYKVGQLKIKALREKAKAELGDKFDLRSFHDAVLSQGAVTLDVLEAVVDDWLSARKRISTP
ncbi:MAG: DUF885 domain-containing protein [Elusimicrobia bacterium]|nr:DUF885 domain-containing protein [Elusimicrobiota bacterium]